MAILSRPVQSQLSRPIFAGPVYESSAISRQLSTMKPLVYLIGAGPGDPGLLTMRGAECLRHCDVVLYDGLCNPQLLELAPEAKQICVGKHGQQRIWQQDEIIAEILDWASRGKVVCRLKGGDPAVFARTAEEVDALNHSSIPYEIVPGITAALAAGSYAGIPITHRKLASAVALVTGHEEPEKSHSAIDWDVLAKFPGTLVIYMGVTRAKIWSESLMESGMDPATPTALIRRCSLADQKTIHCRLDEVAEKLSPSSRFRPPVIAIIGAVTKLASSMNWIGHRPLLGQRVLITRPAEQATELANLIRSYGGHSLIAPAIEIAPPADWAPVDQAIADLGCTDWLIFSSANGVKFFFERLDQLGLDARALATTSVAVVGRKTAQLLRRYGIRADLIPDDFRAASLLDELGGRVHDQRVTSVRASRGSDELPEGLRHFGASVNEVVGYQHSDIEQADPEITKLLSEQQIDWVTITSSATAKNLRRLYGDLLANARLAAISPVTADCLLELGYQVDLVADPYTIESLVEAIAETT